jgi:hypothetical protein
VQMQLGLGQAADEGFDRGHSNSVAGRLSQGPEAEPGAPYKKILP